MEISWGCLRRSRLGPDQPLARGKLQMMEAGKAPIRYQTIDLSAQNPVDWYSRCDGTEDGEQGKEAEPHEEGWATVGMC